jgi:hypothetical protein
MAVYTQSFLSKSSTPKKRYHDKTKKLQTPWYNKIIDALQLACMEDRTQECYASSIRQPLEYHNKTPGYCGIRASIILPDRSNTSKWSPGTLNISYCG